MSNWMTAKSANGPMLVEWLVRENYLEPSLSARSGYALRRSAAHVNADSFTRRLYDWRRGAWPAFTTVDRYITALGRHVSELPDEIWSDEPRPGLFTEDNPVKKNHREYKRRKRAEKAA
jgi:hypothetical protein